MSGLNAPLGRLSPVPRGAGLRFDLSAMWLRRKREVASVRAKMTLGPGTD
jgi:hypothetical protein